MTDWLQSSFHNGLDISTATLATRLILAFVFGVAVAALYRWTQGSAESCCQTLASTLVLLAILIALVTQVIGNSVARAFSLVGALSLVRFRTEVQDTRDTAFVIFAVVVGMACGAGHLQAACVGVLVGGMAALATRPTPLNPATPGTLYNLTVKLGIAHNAEGLLKRPFEKHLDAYRLLATTTARQGAAFELTYSARLRPQCSPTELLRELNQLEGIQGVSLNAA
ncbi:MAG: DUF4956 domain-containing protein [Acidobacteria bacterium]|nr:DUF4956 domain-containing protein [Acidobacteriota bacterium]MCI0723412.1 DUF4956 domain-containing protein [Acidobacteriota bacterium]